MAFTPDSPFPKSRGHVIKSKDWNDTITEVQRLETAKVNRSGDGITGSLTVSGSVGVGTTAPQEKLQVGTGITFHDGGHKVIAFGWSPSTGKALQVGFPGEIRWAPNGSMSLGMDTQSRQAGATPAIGTALSVQGGNVGIGTPTPADRLDVAGNLRALTGSNPIRFTGSWSGFPDAATNQAEISNDTGTYKTLMIIGNKSAGAGRRVSVWDRLEVNGSFYTSGNAGIGTATPGARLEVNGDIAISGKHAFRGNDPWLRLNQDGAFTAGVHTPGVFAPVSLNVGGYNGWGNPGGGNAWITGSVTIAGNLGTHGYPPSARTPGWGGGIRTYDLEVEATAWIRNGVQTGARDLAENFSSDVDLDPGDVVCMGGDDEYVALSEEPDDGLVLGVVSSRPGLLLNSDHDSDDEGGVFPVALCGRVPCKVVDENGPIEKGDLLTSSSTPGHAMKATSVTIDGHQIHRPGTIIGKAIGSLQAGAGTVEVFVFAK